MSERSQAEGDPLARHSLSASELKQMLAAERTGEAFLVFRDADGHLCLFTAGGRRESNIGRRAEMHLSLPWDNEISGLHAEVHHVGREWAIVDDGLSMNGTFVNGQRINGRQRLRDGDRVRIGRTLLAYRAAQATLVDETISAAAEPPPQLTDTQRRVLVALCRPYRHGGYATPATNQEVADEVFLSVDAVKMHLRALFARFDLADLPQNQKRATLAERALQRGAITFRDLD
jgi:FHA domain